MKKFLALLALAISSASSAQKQVDLKDIGSHIGDTVKVCGKIFGGKFLSKAKGTPTFLNMGGEYPDQLLTIVIWAKERETIRQAKGAPETELVGKEICITGKVELYKDKPQIVFDSSLNK